MLQVLMRVKQEQRVTKDAHRFTEQDAAAQRYAAQVLQIWASHVGFKLATTVEENKFHHSSYKFLTPSCWSFQEYPQFCGCSWVQHSLTTDKDLSFHAQKSLEDFYMLKYCSGLNYKKSDDSTEMCNVWFCFGCGCEGQTHSLHFEEPTYTNEGFQRQESNAEG